MLILYQNWSFIFITLSKSYIFKLYCISSAQQLIFSNIFSYIFFFNQYNYIFFLSKYNFLLSRNPGKIFIKQKPRIKYYYMSRYILFKKIFKFFIDSNFYIQSYINTIKIKNSLINKFYIYIYLYINNNYQINKSWNINKFFFFLACTINYNPNYYDFFYTKSLL